MKRGGIVFFVLFFDSIEWLINYVRSVMTTTVAPENVLSLRLTYTLLDFMLATLDHSSAQIFNVYYWLFSTIPWKSWS